MHFRIPGVTKREKSVFRRKEFSRFFDKLIIKNVQINIFINKNLSKIAMNMAGPTILSINLSGESDKLNLEPTNYRQNNGMFNFKIQDMVQPSS